LDGCLEEGHGAFQVGLRYVIEAFGGMTKVSRKTALNREALYRTVSKSGNPRQDTLEKVLGALGMRLSVVELTAQGKKRKAAGGK
jgi:probable addiction module antidote protein